MEINVTLGGLKEQIGALLKQYLSAAGAELKADLEAEGVRITDRIAELGLRVLQKDPEAIRDAEHLYAQAVGLAALIGMREENRVTNTLNMIAGIVIRSLVAAAVAS